MEDWKYMMATDMPQGKSYIVRKKGIDIEDWNSQRKTWEKNIDAIGAFIGIEGHYERITEKEANNIIAQYA